MHGRQHKALLGNGGTCVEDGGQRRDVQLHLARGAACAHHAVGHDQANHLAYMPDLVQRKNGFVMPKGGEYGVTRNVGRQHHAAHAGHAQRCAGVHAMQRTVRDGGKNGRCIQRALQLGQIVQIGRCAHDLCNSTFVDIGLAHHTGGRYGGNGRAHACTSTEISSKVTPVLPWLSSQKRCIRLPSTCLR